jgi:hypothetical protein
MELASSELGRFPLSTVVAGRLVGTQAQISPLVHRVERIAFECFLAFLEEFLGVLS